MWIYPKYAQNTFLNEYKNIDIEFLSNKKLDSLITNKLKDTYRESNEKNTPYLIILSTLGILIFFFLLLRCPTIYNGHVLFLKSRKCTV